jgi:hypothetical protein
VDTRLTGYSKEDDLLVGPFFRGIVVDGDAAGGIVSAFLGPWDVPMTVSGVNYCSVDDANLKTTSLGNVSPALRVAIPVKIFPKLR